MKRLIAVLGMLVVLAANADGQRYFADYHYIPPPEPETTEKSLLDKRFPLPEASVRAYLDAPTPVHAVDIFPADGPSMKSLVEDAPGHIVAEGRKLDWDAIDLFGPPMVEGARHVFLTALSSAGAHALRVRVDLNGLADDERLWLLDAEGRAAFGPFTNRNAPLTDGWLPTTMGDTVVLALHSPRKNTPLMIVEAVSHFFRPVFSKQRVPLSCNIPIGQESDSVVQKISAGVCLLIIPLGVQQGNCTATLLNTHTAASGAPEPFLLSAAHCFRYNPNYAGTEALWDYRSPDANESDIPLLLALPRNSGTTLYGINEVLDFALLKLTQSPEIGTYGRAWLGWDTRPPDVGDTVQCMHFPQASPMKVSTGTVRSVGESTCMNVACTEAYEQLINVLWHKGVTEQGSSGSTLLAVKQGYRVLGVLSHGTLHSCGDRSNNFDNYGSFAVFFPEVGCHLVSGYECAEPYTSTRRRCFLLRMLGMKSETIHNLRVFRDQVLTPYPWGEQLVKGYYDASPAIGSWIERDRMAAFLFEGLAALGAAWGAAMDTP